MKIMDPPKSFCGPLGVHGPPVGNHYPKFRQQGMSFPGKKIFIKHGLLGRKSDGSDLQFNPLQRIVANFLVVFHWKHILLMVSIRCSWTPITVKIFVNILCNCDVLDLIIHLPKSMGVGTRKGVWGGPMPPCISNFDIFLINLHQNKVVLLVSSG